MLTRREFLVGGSLLGGAFIIDGFIIEPRKARVERVDIGIKGLGEGFDGFTICQITDIHHSPIVSIGYVDSVVGLANSLAPDLVVLTGDYVDMEKRYMAPVIRSLSSLKARLGVLSILGNHDHYVGAGYTEDVLSSHGIPLLKNSNRVIDEGPSALCIAGVRDFIEDSSDAKEALRGVPAELPRVLLSHNPDYSEHLPPGERIDLVLSGHTHGGQVRLPLSYAPVVPSLYGQKYSGGLVRLDRPEGTRVYVSRGVGVVFIPVRFNCPPEITLIRLRRA